MNKIWEDKTLRISLVEEDPSVGDRYTELAKGYAGLQIMSITHTAKEAVGHILGDGSHAVILDLSEVNDILAILRDLKGRTGRKPFIYVIMSEDMEPHSNWDRHDLLDPLGVDYIQSKSQQDFSEEMALDFMDLAKDTLLRHFSRPDNHG